MSPYLLIILQSIAFPFGLSGLLLWRAGHRDVYKVIGNVLIWLIAYAWIIQWPELPPGEAVDWLWLLLVAGIAARYIAHRQMRLFYRTAVFASVITAIAWPVLHYQPSIALVSELVILIFAGHVLFSRIEQIQAVAPALTLTIQATGLAIACALSGSLLVGQLSAALAAVIGGYAILEIFGRLRKTLFSAQQSLVFLPLYLSLLAIARLYAELPSVTTILLLAGPVFCVLVPWRHSWVISLLFNACAIGLVLMNSDNTAYY